MQRLEVDPARHKVAIVGFPGSITLVIAKVLHERGIDLVLVSRRQTAFLKRFIASIDDGTASVETTQQIGDALERCRLVFTATSTGQLIDQQQLLPGSVVFDIAQPKDVIACRPPRRDVLILDTGLISLPAATTDRYRYSGLGINDIPSCLGETMTLTLEQRWENFSLGRELHLPKVEEIGRLAEKHGFVFDSFRTFQKPIPDAQFDLARTALQAHS